MLVFSIGDVILLKEPEVFLLFNWSCDFLCVVERCVLEEWALRARDFRVPEISSEASDRANCKLCKELNCPSGKSSAIKELVEGDFFVRSCVCPACCLLVLLFPVGGVGCAAACATTGFWGGVFCPDGPASELSVGWGWDCSSSWDCSFTFTGTWTSLFSSTFSCDSALSSSSSSRGLL